jgi:U3 small nucleolar RNA-associated protein 22
MDCIQIFTIWMKFMSDVDWLGDNQEKSEEQDNAIGKDTIRHSSSSAYRTLDISGVEKRKSRSAIVMPNHLSTEKQTMINCVQNRLYASDYKNQIASKQVDICVPNTLLDCYKIYSDGPIFLDPTMTVNYFAHLSTSFIHELRSEALKALSCIHAHNNGNISENITSGRKSPFHQLFLENQRFWTRYDAYVRINIRDVLLPFESADSRGKVQLWGHDVHDVGRYESISRGLLKVLQLALGDRVNVIRVLTTGNGSVTGKTLQQVVDDTGGDIGRMSFTETDETLFLPILNSSDQKFQGYAQNSTILPVFNNASDSDIVLGLRINTDNCSRIVDRGPPADDTKATETFVTLWGEKKAQLRRFKDGAIVHAVVWNEVEQYRDDEVFDYDGAEKVGSIVEKIIRLIANIHFLKSSSNSLSKVRFELRDLISLVEGSTQTTTGGLTNRFMNSATILQKDIMSAFDDLSKFFKENSYADDSKLGLPLAIDSVEALSPSLRYSELFPSAPHSFLGGDSKLSKSKKVSSVLIGEPVLVQIRFESSSKWPTDISAMGAAKCAMLIQLAESIEKMKESGDSLVAKFDGPISVTPSYLDLGYRGYCWRIIVRADQEIKMLYSLRNPSPEAISLRESLTRRHVVSASHHFIIHGVHSKHPAASYVVRLAERWIGTHMLSGLFPHEAVELIVASVFTDPAPFDKPSTISCGFLRFLHLLAFHDWERFPLIVDPESHFSNEDRVHIFSEFEATRGDAYLNGPAMYIISPVDKIKSSTDTATSFKPAFTLVHPEKVVLKRASALASRSYDFLMNHILDINDNRIYSKDKWTSIFKEDPQSLLSYSCLLRVNRDFVVDSECSSTNADMIVSTKKEILTPYTRSMISRTEGPKLLQKSAYKNLMSSDSITCNFNPIDVVVDQLRSQLGHLAVFFYNAHSPDVIAALWRPSIFSGQPFTAMNSEFKRPIDIEWDNDSLVVTNITDIVGLLKFITRNVTIDIKVLNGGGYDDTESNHSHKGKRKNSMR